MKSYLSYFKLRIITNIQYRAAAIAGLSTQVFFGIVYVMVYIALYESNTNSVHPMELPQLVSYIWLGQAFLALTFIYIKDEDFILMVRNGNISYELVRPQNFYLKFYIKILSSRLIAAFLRFFPLIIFAFLLPKPYNLILPVSPLNFLVFIIAMIISSILVVALSMIVHILSIFTIDYRGLFTIYGVIGELFMGGIVPLPFLPNFLQRIADFLPFRFITDYPYRIYVGNLPLSGCGSQLLLGIFWIIVSIIIGYRLSKLALKKAVVQGG